MASENYYEALQYAPQLDIALRCAMTKGCEAPVTHLDRHGYVYCASHGATRRMDQPCRKLTAAELRRLRQGETIARY